MVFTSVITGFSPVDKSIVALLAVTTTIKGPSPASDISAKLSANAVSAFVVAVAANKLSAVSESEI